LQSLKTGPISISDVKLFYAPIQLWSSLLLICRSAVTFNTPKAKVAPTTKTALHNKEDAAAQGAVVATSIVAISIFVNAATVRFSNTCFSRVAIVIF
jgi:hypothetical protein